MFMRVINTGSQPGNCYALKSESSEILLLDCGCRYSEILKGISYRISEVSGCLLSHEHGELLLLPLGTGVVSSFFNILEQK